MSDAGMSDTGLSQLVCHPPCEWTVSNDLIDYVAAVAFMEARVALIAKGEAPELIWLLEHPSLYTAGTSARPADLLTAHRFPVHTTGRGGQYTYHGPGQRVIYVMLDVKRRGADVRAFVASLEQWLIDTLAAFNIKGERREGRVGIWVARPNQTQSQSASHIAGQSADGEQQLREDKIAAIGIRLRKWVSYHGMSFNVDPDLSHFEGIVPCGITGHGVTSLAALGYTLSLAEVDMALRSAFAQRLGRTQFIKPALIEGLP